MRAKDALGRHGEELAARHLIEQGLVVLDRNWRCDVGEVDIVARDGDALVVCEVKTRRSRRVRQSARGDHPAEGSPAAPARGLLGAGARRPARGDPHRRGRVVLRALSSAPDAAEIEHVRGAIWLSTASAHRRDAHRRPRPAGRVEIDASPGVPGMSVVGLPDTAVRRGPRPGPGGDRQQRGGVAGVARSPSACRRRRCASAAAASTWRSPAACLAAFGSLPPRGARPLGAASASSAWTARPAGAGLLPMVLAAVSAGHRTSAGAEGNGGEAALVPGAEVAVVARPPEAVGLLRGERATAVGRRRVSPGRRAGRRPRPRRRQRPARRPARGRGGGRGRPPPAAARSRREPARRLLAERLPGLLPPLDRAAGARGHRDPLGRRRPGRRGTRWSCGRRSRHRTTPRRRPPSSAAAAVSPGRARSASPTAVCSSSTRRRSSPARCSTRCASRWSPGRWSSPAPSAAVTYPARFQLVLAANPCPCGRGRWRAVACPRLHLHPGQTRRYGARLTGPLLDRVDLRVPVPPLTGPSWSTAGAGEPSGPVRERVLRRPRTDRSTTVRDTLDHQRRGARPGAAWALPGGSRRRWRVVLEEVGRGRLSARGVDRVLRVAWTLADLAGVDRPGRPRWPAPSACGEGACRGRRDRGGAPSDAERAARATRAARRARRRASGGGRPDARRRARCWTGRAPGPHAAGAWPTTACPAALRPRGRPRAAGPSAAAGSCVPGDVEWPTQLADLGAGEPLGLFVRGRRPPARRGALGRRGRCAGGHVVRAARRQRAGRRPGRPGLDGRGLRRGVRDRRRRPPRRAGGGRQHGGGPRLRGRRGLPAGPHRAA